MRLAIFAVLGIPEVEAGTDIAGSAVSALRQQGDELCDGDVVVVAQKVVSKSEGRVRALATVSPTPRATALAQRLGADPAMVQVVLDESVRVLRDDRVLIVETSHGFVCANGGVDRSNLADPGSVLLLPRDPDGSADDLRRRFGELTGREVGVIVSDSFGRPWRMGLTNVALGVAGVPALHDYRGTPDQHGRAMSATVIAHADEIAGAAELVMGKRDRVPVAVVRGWTRTSDGSSGRALLRPAAQDLFR